MSVSYDWVGTNSKGESRIGRSELGRTLALWVERKFDLGWRTLTVYKAVDGDRDVVASIERRYQDGKRSWWSE